MSQNQLDQIVFVKNNMCILLITYTLMGYTKKKPIKFLLGTASVTNKIAISIMNKVSCS